MTCGIAMPPLPPVFGWTREVLLVGDLRHPIDDFAVERFLDGDMRHRRRRRGAVPMLLARWTPDHITGPDFLDGFAPALGPTEASRDNQALPERMRVPCGSRPRLETDACAADTRGLGGLEEGIDPD